VAHSYRMREVGARQALVRAFDTFCEAPPPGTTICPARAVRMQFDPSSTERLSTLRNLNAIGAEVSSVVNLLSYFRSNYTVGGITVTGQDDALLMTAVASELGRRNVPILTADASSGVAPAQCIDRQIGVLEGLRRQNAQALNIVKAKIASLRAPLNANSTPAERLRVEAEAAPFVEMESQLSSAISLYDDLRKTLFDASAGATPAIGPVLNAMALEERLNATRGRLLWVRLNSANGGYYTESNVWTFLGSVPIHYAGGVVVSYRLIQYDEGRLVEAGIVPVFTGHIRAGSVRNHLPDGDPPPPRRRGRLGGRP